MARDNWKGHEHKGRHTLIGSFTPPSSAPMFPPPRWGSIKSATCFDSGTAYVIAAEAESSRDTKGANRMGERAPAEAVNGSGCFRKR